MSSDFVGVPGMRTIEFCCDNCGETFDSEEETFREAAAKIKEEGWRITKNRDTWEHFCPECGR